MESWTAKKNLAEYQKELEKLNQEVEKTLDLLIKFFVMNKMTPHCSICAMASLLTSMLSQEKESGHFYTVLDHMAESYEKEIKG